jgi:hypothetical protein
VGEGLGVDGEAANVSSADVALDVRRFRLRNDVRDGLRPLLGLLSATTFKRFGNVPDDCEGCGTERSSNCTLWRSFRRRPKLFFRFTLGCGMYTRCGGSTTTGMNEVEDCRGDGLF